MSGGTLRVLGLLTAVFQRPAPSLIVIEEPEASMHPAAFGAILDLLQHADQVMQVIVTTHSPDLLDAKWIGDANSGSQVGGRGDSDQPGFGVNARMPPGTCRSEPASCSAQTRSPRSRFSRLILRVTSCSTKTSVSDDLADRRGPRRSRRPADSAQAAGRRSAHLCGGWRPQQETPRSACDMGAIEQAVGIALRQRDCAAVLILFDGDDD